MNFMSQHWLARWILPSLKCISVESIDSNQELANQGADLYTQEEDRKNHERMQTMIDNLQQKIKSYKKQIEAAEVIAALNLSK